MLKTLYYTPYRGAARRAVIDPMGDQVVVGDADCNDGLLGEAIKCQPVPDKGLRVVASRSHLNDETKKYLEDFDVAEFLSAGSSLKFCLLAEGKADFYPRLSPTMEWDTAAGQAVLEAAGGAVLDEEGAPFVYGKTDRGFLNGGFIASGARS